MIVVLLAIANSGPSDSEIVSAINLQASDLPGYRVDPANGPSGVHIDHRIPGCPDLIGSNPGRPRGASPYFLGGSGLGAAEISSLVEIARSSQMVAHDFAQLESRRLWSCFARQMNTMTQSLGNEVPVSVSDTRVTPFTAIAPGSNQSQGLRMTMRINAMGRSVPAVADVLAYGVGRDELLLYSFTLVDPLPAATEAQLSSLLINRALAQPH